MADVPIVYRFIAAGPDSVVSAFKAVSAAAKQSTKEVEAAARTRDRAARAPSAGRAPADRAAADADKAAKQAERAAKRSADAQIREHGRALDHVARIRDRHFRTEQRQEEQAARTRAALAQRAANDTAKWKDRANKSFERAQGRTRDERMRTLTGLGKDAALAGVGAGSALLGVVGQAAREGVQLQDIANRLSISARGAGEKGADPATLRKEFEAAAIANPGVKATDVAAGAAGFVAKTGDLAAARRFSGTFATVSSASGASVEDISNAAADLFQKFDIKSIDEMQAALASLTMQGKAGAFEIRDAAAQFAKMSAAASRFGLSKGSEGVKILGGLTQIARSATGSPEQAATAVEATFRQLIGESKQIKAMGVDVFQKGSTSKTRDVRDVLTETIAKSGGSLPKLQKIFGEEGIRGISPLISAFNEAKAGSTAKDDAGKTADGVKALRDALASAIDAPGDWSEIVKDSAQAQQSAGAQLDAAWERIKATVAGEALPAILKLVPAMSSLAVSGIGPAVVVFTALVEAAGDVVSAFKLMGMFTPKEMTPNQRLAKAKGELDTFNAKMDKRIGPITADEAAQRANLEAAVAAADRQAFTTSDVTTTTKGSGKGPASMTPEDFAKAYVEASGVEDDFLHSGVRGDMELKAQRLAGALADNPNDTAGLPGETDAQRKLREGYSSQMIGQQATAQVDANGRIDAGTASPPELLQSAQALLRAATALERSGNAGSITGGKQ